MTLRELLSRNRIKEHWPELLVLFLFGAIYSLISLVNHSNFRTAALDLGLYTNAAWKYAHFTLPDRSLFLFNDDPLLADHFDLHLVLWAPLTYLFGEWTLLIVQIVAILAGGLGVYRYILATNGDRAIALMATAMGCSFFGVISAVSFDFHSNVVVAMALPWYLLSLKQGKVAGSWLILLFMLTGKENIGLWMGVVALAALALPRNIRTSTLIAHSFVAFGWSAMIMGLVMPALDNSGGYAHFDYSVIGDNAGEALLFLIDKPFRAFRALFEDVQGKHPFGTGIKLEFHFLLLISGGWALLRAWPFLLMALPLIAQKMWHDDPAKWGLFSQYSVEFSLILPLAVVAVISGPVNKKVAPWTMLVALVLTLGATVHTLEFPLEHKERDHGYHDRSRFYQERHYGPPFPAQLLHEVMAGIPKDVALSCQTTIVPHMIERRHLYQFPITWQADMVLLAPMDNKYPLTSEEFHEEVRKMRTSGDWETMVDDETVILFKRIGPRQQ